MELYITIIVLSILTFQAGRWSVYRQESKKMPFRWSCEECGVRVRASNHEQVLKFADKHERMGHASPEL